MKATRDVRAKSSALFLAGFVFCQVVFSQSDWHPTLLPAADGVARADQPLRILLPPEVGDDVLQWLALELDNVDVSQLVRLETVAEGRIVSVTPPQPLVYGAHTLRLVQYTEQGDILERGLWTVEIRQSRAWREAAFAANITAQAAERISDGELPDLPDSFQGQGGAGLQGRAAAGAWELTGSANVLYDSHGVQFADDTGEGDRDDHFDLEYLFGGRYQSLSSLIGHHAMEGQSLIMQDFHRRGVSISAVTPNQMVSASGFAFRTEPISGFRYGLGIGNREHRVAGAMLSARPIPGRDQALTVTATYLKGEGEDQNGVGVAGVGSAARGDGWSIVAESRVVGDRVRVRGEYAETEFDFDGDSGGFEDRRDDAYDLVVQLVPWRDLSLRGEPAYFDVGMEMQEVGLFFRSLANPTLPSDKELIRAFSTFQWSGLAVQLQGGREQDNVDDDPLIPTLRNGLAGLLLSFSPPQTVDENGLPRRRWYGQPTFSFSSQYARQEHVRLPGGFLGTSVDQRVAQHQLDAAFQYDNWGWSVGYGYGSERDLTGVFGDRRSELTSLAGNWRFADRLLIAGQLQYNPIRDSASGITTRSFIADLNAELALLPRRLTLGLNASLNRDGASDDSIDTETATYGFNLTWQALLARGMRPGLALWLRGERQEFEDRLFPANDRNPYQVFVGVTVNWPVQFPKTY